MAALFEIWIFLTLLCLHFELLTGIIAGVYPHNWHNYHWRAKDRRCYTIVEKIIDDPDSIESQPCGTTSDRPCYAVFGHDAQAVFPDSDINRDPFTTFCNTVFKASFRLPTGVNSGDPSVLKVGFFKILGQHKREFVPASKVDPDTPPDISGDNIEAAVPQILLDHRFFVHGLCPTLCPCFGHEYCLIKDKGYLICSSIPCGEHQIFGTHVPEAQQKPLEDCHAENTNGVRGCWKVISDLAGLVFDASIEPVYEQATPLLSWIFYSGSLVQSDLVCRYAQLNYNTCGDSVQNPCFFGQRYLLGHMCNRCYLATLSMRICNNDDRSYECQFVKSKNLQLYFRPLLPVNSSITEFRQYYTLDAPLGNKIAERFCSSGYFCLSADGTTAACHEEPCTNGVANFRHDVINPYVHLQQIDCASGLQLKLNFCERGFYEDSIAYRSPKLIVTSSGSRCDCGPLHSWEPRIHKCIKSHRTVRMSQQLSGETPLFTVASFDVVKPICKGNPFVSSQTEGTCGKTSYDPCLMILTVHDPLSHYIEMDCDLCYKATIRLRTCELGCWSSIEFYAKHYGMVQNNLAESQKPHGFVEGTLRGIISRTCENVCLGSNSDFCGEGCASTEDINDYPILDLIENNRVIWTEVQCDNACEPNPCIDTEATTAECTPYQYTRGYSCVCQYDLVWSDQMKNCISETDLVDETDNTLEGCGC